MDVASAGIEEEEDLSWGLEGHLARGDVLVVGDGAGG